MARNEAFRRKQNQLHFLLTLPFLIEFPLQINLLFVGVCLKLELELKTFNSNQTSIQTKQQN